MSDQSGEPQSSGEPLSPSEPRSDVDVDVLRLKRHAILSTALPFPKLDWRNQKNDAENLKEIRDYSESLANSTLEWYLAHHKSKKRTDRRGCSAGKSGRAKRHCRARRHRLPDGLLANPAVPRSDRLAFCQGREKRQPQGRGRMILRLARGRFSLPQESVHRQQRRMRDKPFQR